MSLERAKSIFRPFADSGDFFDAKQAMKHFVLDVIGMCAFSLKFNTIEDATSFHNEVQATMSDPGRKMALRTALRLVNPKLLKLFRLKEFPEKVEKFFYELLRGAEKTRQETKFHRGDLLQLMLDTRDQKDDDASCKLFT